MISNLSGTFDMNKLLLKAAQTGNIQAIANLIDPVDKNMPCVSVNDAIDKVRMKAGGSPRE